METILITPETRQQVIDISLHTSFKLNLRDFNPLNTEHIRSIKNVKFDNNMKEFVGIVKIQGKNIVVAYDSDSQTWDVDLRRTRNLEN